MSDSPFKRTTLAEMCKQVVSAPVIFMKQDGTECLAFFNNEDSTKATKLYILFSGTTPKYIEGNDIYSMREHIYQNIGKAKAINLYDKINWTHKISTLAFFRSLIDKAPVPDVEKQECKTFNRKHACGYVTYKGASFITVMKDLMGNNASEMYVDHSFIYNVTLDAVHWAVGISAKDFTSFKVKMLKMSNNNN